jgi:hypothetical protein
LYAHEDPPATQQTITIISTILPDFMKPSADGGLFVYWTKQSLMKMQYFAISAFVYIGAPEMNGIPPRCLAISQLCGKTYIGILAGPTMTESSICAETSLCAR